MADIIIPWSGAHASIPAGWTRYTALDNKFPKASGADAATVTGGSATHTHTSAAHSHTLATHTHTYTSGAFSGGAGNKAPTGLLSRKTHTHSGTSGAVSGGTTETTAVTYESVSNNPPYHELIFIKAALDTIPVDGVIMWDQVSAPSNTDFKVTDGTLSTVDLNGKYIKSANTAGNSGGTGGSTTNSHTITHTHTTNTHTHASASTGGSSSIGGEDNSAGGGDLRDHTHTASFAAGTQAIDSFTDALVTAETVEPEYHTLMAYQNKGASAAAIPLNSIAMTVDGTYPAGWSLCDGTGGTQNLTDKFVKISTSSGDIGNTGGANTHTHASQSHIHTSTGGHTHTVSFNTVSSPGYNGIGGGVDVAGGHTHSNSTSASTSATYASGTTSADSSANQPEYVVVNYIQKISAGTQAGFLMLFA